MVSILIWIILFISFLVVGILKLFGAQTWGAEKYDLILLISGSLSLLVNLFQSLQKNSLPFYFFTRRRIYKFRNARAKWWLCVRYDGNYELEVVDRFRNFLTDVVKNSSAVHIKLGQSNQVNFIINETLNFYFTYHNRLSNGLTYDFISIELTALEIGYNDAEVKLNREIFPLLEQFSKFFKSENQSYEFHIQFTGMNPFFAIYINHLSPDYVKDFQIHLHVKDYDPNADSVLINKDKIRIVTKSEHSLKELSKDFLLLSPNVKKLIKQGNA